MSDETPWDPGPLSVQGRQTKTEIGGFYVIGPDRIGSATAYVSGPANAALYASAPALYEALADMLAKLDQFAAEIAEPMFVEERDALRAALNKALGGVS